MYFLKPDRIVVGVRSERDSLSRWAVATTDYRSNRMDVGGIGGNDQTRDQCLFGDLGRVRQ